MKKKIFNIICICSILLLLLIITSCSKKYTISFYVDNNITEQIEVKKGKTVTKIVDPIKENHIFVGWLKDNVLFDFDTKIKEDINLYASFKHICEKGHNWTEATLENPKTCNRCGITEGDKIPAVASIEIITSAPEVYLEETITLSAVCYPVGSNQEVTWSIRTYEGSNATITEDGILTGVASGTIYVTATSKQNQYITKTIAIPVLHHLIDEEVFDAFNIMTGIGSDASTQMEINYHTHNNRTSLEYTIASDTDFNNYTSVTGVGYYFEDMRTEELESIFTPRNIIRVSLKDLKPNTEYIYRINKGNDTYSEVHHFKTAANDGSSSSFLVMSDIHFNAVYNEDGTYKSNGSEISEQIVTKALELNPNIGFIATTGDIIDRGGSANTWDLFFSLSNSLRQMPRVGVAGNHEYYMKTTGQTDFRFQKAHYATTLNGPSTQLGASGYFIYNDILFIIIDNERALGQVELAWIDDVLTNNNATYTIAMMHRPIFYEKDETSNNDRNESLMGIFEKHSVDLVLSGHYHSDKYRPDYYEGQTSTDPYLGVNYLGLYEAGVKASSATNLPSGYIIETNNGTITITRINSNGEIIKTRTITSKKNQEYTTETKENLINAITTAFNSDNLTYTINFSNSFYGNVKNVSVVETIRGKIVTNVVFPTPSYNKLVIKNINNFYDYRFEITITFSDGSKETLIKELILSTDATLTSSNVTNNSATINFTAADESLAYYINKYVVYINGIEYTTFNALNEFYDPISSYTINGLESNKEYRITLASISRIGEVLYTKEIIIKTK